MHFAKNRDERVSDFRKFFTGHCCLITNVKTLENRYQVLLNVFPIKIVFEFGDAGSADVFVMLSAAFPVHRGSLESDKEFYICFKRLRPWILSLGGFTAPPSSTLQLPYLTKIEIFHCHPWKKQNCKATCNIIFKVYILRNFKLLNWSTMH